MGSKCKAVEAIQTGCIMINRPSKTYTNEAQEDTPRSVKTARLFRTLAGLSGLVSVGAFLSTAAYVAMPTLGAGWPIALGVIGAFLLAGLGIGVYKYVTDDFRSSVKNASKNSLRFRIKDYALVNTLLSVAMLVVGSLAVAGVLSIPFMNVAAAGVMIGFAAFSLLCHFLVLPGLNRQAERDMLTHPSFDEEDTPPTLVVGGRSEGFYPTQQAFTSKSGPVTGTKVAGNALTGSSSNLVAGNPFMAPSTTTQAPITQAPITQAPKLTHH